MNWNRLFGIEEEPKPKNIYESELFGEYLDSKNLKDSSKRTYTTYRDRLVDFINAAGVKSVDKDIAKRFLVHQRDKTGAKQARDRHTFFRDYCNWLILKGKLDYNPWTEVNLDEIGCSMDDIRYERIAKMKPNRKVDTETKRFALSDIAELLIAIEDNDEDEIMRILTV